MILDLLPLNREMTMNDILNRVKEKTGRDISPEAVEIALTRAWEDGQVEAGDITTHGGGRRAKVQTFTRVR